MTYLEILNAVMTRLRKNDATTSSDSVYIEMAADMVKDALMEVESAWNWNALRTTVQVTTAADDYSYVLTGAGPQYSFLSVFNVTHTSKYELVKAPASAWMTERLLQDTATNIPQYFDVNGESGGDPIVNLWPIPNGVYNINFNIVARTVISADSDVISDTYSRAVKLRALMSAVEERGDDGGQSLAYLQAQYTKALGDAIAFDAMIHEQETTWYED